MSIERDGESVRLVERCYERAGSESIPFTPPPGGTIVGVQWDTEAVVVTFMVPVQIDGSPSDG